MTHFRSAPAVLLLLLTAQANGDANTAKWLVDLGRDYPLSAQASVTDVDAEITLLLMQAGSQIDPTLAEAYLWQFDMLTALGRDEDARRALGEYVQRQPEDVAAALRWIQLTAGTLQTAEQRAEFFQACLKGEKGERLAKSVASDLHRRMAEFYWNRGENLHADAEAMAALQADPLNLAARLVLEKVRNAPQTPLLRVQHLLAMIAASPANIDLARQLGREFVLLGLPAEADRWFQHAISVHALLPPGDPPPDLLAERSSALLDAGNIEQAREVANRAIAADPNNVAARLTLYRAARKTNDQAAAAEHVAAAAKVWTLVLANAPREGLRPNVLAEMSWFFTHYAGKHEEAAKIARTALLTDPRFEIALRALGAALRAMNDLPQAGQTLTPAADTDMWAAIELARVEHAAGQTDAGVQRLRRLATQPADGEQRETIQNLLAEWGTTATATRPASDEIETALRAFPYEILNFPMNPERYLTAKISLPQQELGPDQPWLCTVSLENKAPFSITIAPEGMIHPELLCSIQTRGDKERSSGPSIRILLNRKLRLRPGESMQVNQTLGIGPIRAAMIATPQVTQSVEVTALLNPIRLVAADGREVWAPAPGGFVLPPLRFTRSSFVATPEAVRSLLARAQSGEAGERIAAMELLAMLLAEHQHLAAGRLGYVVRRVDPAAIQPAILACAKDADWRVRAHLAEAMRWFVLDESAAETGTRMLADPHWLVRGLALRMMADQYRDKFRAVLSRFAGSAATEWERRVGLALGQRIEMYATATAPAAAKPTAPPATAPAAATTAPETSNDDRGLLNLPD